jgi:hypothetical protein
MSDVHCQCDWGFARLTDLHMRRQKMAGLIDVNLKNRHPAVKESVDGSDCNNRYGLGL